MGATIAGGPTIGGHRLARAAIIGVPLIAVAVALIVDLGPKALPIWVAASPLAYPFLRYPFHRGGYVTFDRVWIFALFLILLRLPRPPAQAGRANLLRNGMVLLAVVYGTRLLLAPFGSLTEARYWLDAMVLPIVVYSVTRRVVFEQGEGGVVGALVVAGVVMSIISIAELVLGFSLAGFSGGTAVFDALAGVQRVSGPYASNASSSTAALVCLAAAIYWTRQRSGDAKNCRVHRDRHHRRRRLGVVPSRCRHRGCRDLHPRHRSRGPQPQRALRHDQHDRRRRGTRLLRRVGNRGPFDLLPGTRCLDDKCHGQVRVVGPECRDLQAVTSNRRRRRAGSSRAAETGPVHVRRPAGRSDHTQQLSDRAGGEWRRR